VYLEPFEVFALLLLDLQLGLLLLELLRFGLLRPLVVSPRSTLL